MNIFDIMYDDFKFDKDKPIKLFEAFSGYGSQYMALKRLGVKVDVVGYSEIDKFAIQVYEALHGKHKNYGGIGSFDRLPKDIDICTWSFPCQDISLAGKQRGMEDGSRSNYGYVFLDTVEATPYHERPKVLLMENVKALFTQKFRDDWRKIQLRLERMGYTNYADVLNAKDYGVAQNRERIFIVSILGEYNYTFPKPIPLTKRLKDYLEDEVDEKYYLSSKMIENTFLNYKGNHKKGGFKRDKIFIENVNRKEISQTVTTKMDRAESQYVTEPFEATIVDLKSSIGYQAKPNSEIAPTQYAQEHYGIIIPEATKQGYALAQDGDGVYINRPHQKRGVVQKGMIQTLKTSGADVGVVVKDTRNLKEKLADSLIESGIVKGGEIINHSYAVNRMATRERLIESDDGIMPTLTTRPDTLGVVTNIPLRIRKLTPREVLRLMDVSESDIDIITSTVSNAQAYKLAGNSIVVSVLVEIFRQLIKEESNK